MTVELDILAEYQKLEEQISQMFSVHRKHLAPLYERRDELLKEMATRSYKLPRPLNRTETQQRVARCPRCRGVLE